MGHKDARHSAAEIALEADAEIAALKQRQGWIDRVARPDHPDDERPWAAAYLDAKAEVDALKSHLDFTMSFRRRDGSEMELNEAQQHLLQVQVRSFRKQVDEMREELSRLKSALEEIRDQDPVENALDPQWAARIAKEALK